MKQICFVSLSGQSQIFGKAFGCFQKEIRFPKNQLGKQKVWPSNWWSVSDFPSTNRCQETGVLKSIVWK